MLHYVGSLMPVIILVGFALVVLNALGNNRGGRVQYRAKAIMTPTEIAFWHILRQVAAPWHIAPQVSMGALLYARGGYGQSERRGARNRFSQKMIEFVLLDEDGSVRLLIELDDRTHRQARDAARDQMTASAGYKTLRVTGRLKTDRMTLRLAIENAL